MTPDTPLIPDSVHGAVLLSVIDFFLSFVVIAFIGVVLALFPHLNRIGKALQATPVAVAVVPAEDEGAREAAVIAAAIHSMLGVRRIVRIGLALLFVGLIGRISPVLSDTFALLQSMLLYGVLINLALAAFNLIPIPPLDGSHVFKYILPPAWALNYQRLGAQGLLILFLLISFGSPILNLWFKPVFLLDRLATRAVFPYILPSPWTM